MTFGSRDERYTPERSRTADGALGSTALNLFGGSHEALL
jgi:hypothetical protein